MAKKKRRSSRRPAKSRRTPARSTTSPVVAMLFGLAVGLSVAVAVYVKDRQPVAAAEEARVEAPVAGGHAGPNLDASGETIAAEAAPAEGASDTQKRFTFYDILPNVEMVTPEEQPTSETDSAPQAVVEPGVYVLQAGSFSTSSDADRRRAELALHGIESHTQRVKVNDRNYHRVYIGPTEDLDELNMLRSRLRAAKIEVLRIRLSDD